MEFLVLANGIIEGLPRGRSHLADQFTRASLSIVLNLALLADLPKLRGNVSLLMNGLIAESP